MRVKYTFRLNYKRVAMVDPGLLALESEEVDPLQLTVVLEAYERDELFDRVARAERLCRAQTGSSLIRSWTPIRSYDRAEVDAASAFFLRSHLSVAHLRRRLRHELRHEHGLPVLSVGSEVRGPFYIDTRKIPKRYDLVRSNDFEFLVSQRFVEMVIDEGLTGMRLTPVTYKAAPITHTYLDATPSGRLILEAASKHGLTDLNSFEAVAFINRQEFDTLFAQSVDEWSKRVSKSIKLHRARPWYRLEVSSPQIAADEKTRYGSQLFDDEGLGGTCPLRHLGGENIVSEVWLTTALPGNVDIAELAPGIGYVALDMLWAYRPLIISQRFRKALARWKIGGTYLEIARVGDEPTASA